MNKTTSKKTKNITHLHSGRMIVGGGRANDRKFLQGNEKVLQKLLHIFNKKS